MFSKSCQNRCHMLQLHPCIQFTQVSLHFSHKSTNNLAGFLDLSFRTMLQNQCFFTNNNTKGPHGGTCQTDQDGRRYSSHCRTLYWPPQKRESECLSSFELNFRRTKIKMPKTLQVCSRNVDLLEDNFFLSFFTRICDGQTNHQSLSQHFTITILDKNVNFRKKLLKELLVLVTTQENPTPARLQKHSQRSLYYRSFHPSPKTAP